LFYGTVKSWKRSITADVLEAGKLLFTTTYKSFDPAFEGLGMDVENGTDGIGILATVEKEEKGL
jgi:hypothetical protein